MSQALVRTGNKGMSLVPQTLTEATELAGLLAQSTIVPIDFRGKPGDVLVAMMMGGEVGLSPIQSLQNIAVINGRPCIWGDSANDTPCQAIPPQYAVSPVIRAAPGVPAHAGDVVLHRAQRQRNRSPCPARHKRRKSSFRHKSVPLNG